MARIPSQKELAARERGRIASQWERLQTAADADVAPQRDAVVAESRRVKETAGNDDQALIEGMSPLLHRLDALLQTPARCPQRHGLLYKQFGNLSERMFWAPRADFASRRPPTSTPLPTSPALSTSWWDLCWSGTWPYSPKPHRQQLPNFFEIET